MIPSKFHKTSEHWHGKRCKIRLWEIWDFPSAHHPLHPPSVRSLTTIKSEKERCVRDWNRSIQELDFSNVKCSKLKLKWLIAQRYYEQDIFYPKFRWKSIYFSWCCFERKTSFLRIQTEFEPTHRWFSRGQAVTWKKNDTPSGTRGRKTNEKVGDTSQWRMYCNTAPGSHKLTS